jgi:multidrug efflux pump subunit AcrA (membrane-fusion protein)
MRGFAAASSLIAALLLASCGGDDEEVLLRSAALEIESSIEADVLASSQSLIAGAPADAPVYLGLVSPMRVADVSFEVPGTVKSVLVGVGDTVTRGQLLAELETDSRRQKLAEAYKRLADARAARPGASRSSPDAPPPEWMVDEARAIKEEAERREDLSAGDRSSFQAAARREGEEAARDRAIALAARRGGRRPSVSQVRRAAEDSLALALVDDNAQRVRQLEDAIANSSLKAPWDGIVVGVTARAGEEWNTRSVYAAVQLVDPTSFVVQIVIPVLRAKKLQEGELAWVELPALGSTATTVVRARWMSIGEESSQLAGGAAWVNAVFQLPNNLPRRVLMGEEVRVVLQP